MILTTKILNKLYNKLLVINKLPVINKLLVTNKLPVINKLPVANKLLVTYTKQQVSLLMMEIVFLACGKFATIWGDKLAMPRWLNKLIMTQIGNM